MQFIKKTAPKPKESTQNIPKRPKKGTIWRILVQNFEEITF